MTAKKKDEEVVRDFEIPFTGYYQILHAAGVQADPAIELEELLADIDDNATKEK